MYQVFKVSLLIPLLFLLYSSVSMSTISDQSAFKANKKILWRTNVIYIAFTIVACSVNIAHAYYTKDSHHVLKICTLLPFMFCLVIYIVSIGRIQRFLKKTRIFFANKYLTTYPCLILMAYVIHLLRWPVLDWWLDIEEDYSTKALLIKFCFFCIRQMILMLVAFTMYKFTDKSKI